MIIFKRTFTRPSVNIPWHQEVLSPPQDWKDRWQYYLISGKVLDVQYVPSVDNLSYTYTAVWKSLEDFHQYDNDSVMDEYWAQRDAYCTANDITMSGKIIEFHNQVIEASPRTENVPFGKWDLGEISG